MVVSEFDGEEYAAPTRTKAKRSHVFLTKAVRSQAVITAKAE
jgi:hypothetical protein